MNALCGIRDGVQAGRSVGESIRVALRNVFLTLRVRLWRQFSLTRSVRSTTVTDSLVLRDLFTALVAQPIVAVFDSLDGRFNLFENVLLASRELAIYVFGSQRLLP